CTWALLRAVSGRHNPPLTFRSESGLVRWGRGVLGGAQKLLAEDRHIARGFDPQANFAAIDIDDGDANIVVDVDLFTQFSAEHQHFATLLRASQTGSGSILAHVWQRTGRPAGIFSVRCWHGTGNTDITAATGPTRDTHTRLNSFKTIMFQS